MKKTYIKPEMETEVMELESMIAASDGDLHLEWDKDEANWEDQDAKRRGIWDTW